MVVRECPTTRCIPGDGYQDLAGKPAREFAAMTSYRSHAMYDDTIQYNTTTSMVVRECPTTRCIPGDGYQDLAGKPAREFAAMTSYRSHAMYDDTKLLSFVLRY